MNHARRAHFILCLTTDRNLVPIFKVNMFDLAPVNKTWHIRERKQTFAFQTLCISWLWGANLQILWLSACPGSTFHLRPSGCRLNNFIFIWRLTRKMDRIGFHLFVSTSVYVEYEWSNHSYSYGVTPNKQRVNKSGFWHAYALHTHTRSPQHPSPVFTKHK